MTERWYFNNDALQAESQVLSCQPYDDGLFALQLSGTLFHPQGGGQLSDSGTLNQLPLLRLVQQGDQLLHILPAPLPVGPVSLLVDAQTRQLHSRLHSGGHLIGYSGEALGWQPIKAHHWPGEGRITFTPTSSAAEITTQQLQQQVDHWISQDLARIQTLRGERREVSFAGLGVYACGGTHVASLAAIGRVVISAIKQKKGQLAVYYDVAEA